MEWYEAREIADGVTLILEPLVHDFFRANAYRIRGRDVDLQFDFTAGLSSMAAFLPGGDRPLMAIASHVHIDHVGCFHEFAWRAGHGAEALAYASMADDWTLADMFRTIARPVERPPHPGFDIARYAIAPAPLTQELVEGERIDLGDQCFTVLHLPGHSPGSIGLFDETNGVLFSGDAIYQGGLVDDVRHADRAQYRVTMARLAELDVAIVHPGHGDSFGREIMRSIALEYLERTES